jgi:hypothetical protein
MFGFWPLFYLLRWNGRSKYKNMNNFEVFYLCDIFTQQLKSGCQCLFSDNSVCCKTFNHVTNDSQQCSGFDDYFICCAEIEDLNIKKWIISNYFIFMMFFTHQLKSICQCLFSDNSVCCKTFNHVTNNSPQLYFCNIFSHVKYDNWKYSRFYHYFS